MTPSVILGLLNLGVSFAVAYMQRYHDLRRAGRCYRCRKKSRPGKALCKPCSDRETRRRTAYARQQGATPRYDNHRGYGPRVQLTAPVLTVRPKDCPRCHGCLVRERLISLAGDSRQLRCLNCGNVLVIQFKAEGTGR